MLRNVLEIVLHRAHSGDFAENVPVRSIEARILSAIASCFEPSGRLLESAHSRIAGRAMNYLRKRGEEVLYLADLCLSLGVSERWLREAFQSTMG